MKYTLTHSRGFTLVELLVVISIIGLLSSFATVSLNNARAQSRDAKRFSDIRQMQLAVELCFNEGNSYPLQNTLGPLPLNFNCSALELEPLLSAFISSVPLDPLTYQPYLYCSADRDDPLGGCDGTVGTSYQIEFTLEGETGTLSAGTYCVIPAGVLAGPC